MKLFKLFELHFFPHSFIHLSIHLTHIVEYLIVRTVRGYYYKMMKVIRITVHEACTIITHDK